MTSLARTTASASTFVTGDRVAVLVFLAPEFYLFLLGTLDASLSHLPVVLYLCFRKLSVLPEDDVEAKSEDAKSYEDYGCNQYLHLSSKKFLVDEA